MLYMKIQDKLKQIRGRVAKLRSQIHAKPTIPHKRMDKVLPRHAKHKDDLTPATTRKFQAQVHAHPYEGEHGETLGDLQYFEVGPMRDTLEEAQADFKKWDSDNFDYYVERSFVEVSIGGEPTIRVPAE